MENGKRTFNEVLVILFIGFLIAWACYYLLKQPQVESGNIYISGTIQDNGQTNRTQTGEKDPWNADLNVRKNKTSVIEQRTWSIEPTHSKPIQSLQLMSDDTVVYVKWFPEDSLATKIATYAYKISSWSLDFLMTLKAENGWFDMFKQSNVVKNWIREDSRGLCQLHRTWHKDIVDTKEFWESREYQVEKCWEKYSWGTKFYGYYVRNKYKDHFTIINK